MNNTVTSKQALLDAAKEIAYRDGPDKLNIRSVAAACGISVGAVYNYFPAKADLVFALVEDFWGHLTREGKCPFSPQGGFPDYFEQVFLGFSVRLKDFEAEFLRQMALLSDIEKEKGRAIESAYWVHMRNGLLAALRQDPQIAPAVWTAAFTQEAFADFAFSNMIGLLKGGQTDCLFFKETLTRLLYP